MHLSIKTYLTLLPICFFLYTASLLGQSAGFHLQTEQGISALNNFNMTRNKGAFGGYATSLGGTYTSLLVSTSGPTYSTYPHNSSFATTTLT